MYVEIISERKQFDMVTCVLMEMHITVSTTN